MENDHKKLGGGYSENSFWQKMSDLPRSVGRELAGDEGEEPVREDV